LDNIPKDLPPDKLGRKAQKAFDTFLRNSYRTHTNLSALADKKANILIRFNSILISILLIFFKEILEIYPSILYSIFVFLITSLVSLAFATMAARPHMNEYIQSGDSLDAHAMEHLFFFGNFIKLPYEKYEAGMMNIMQDHQLIYNTMIRDIYNLGEILDIKFKYIKWSYNVFLVGLTITVISFLFSFLLIN